MAKTSRFFADLEDADSGLDKLKILRVMGAEKQKQKTLRRREEAKM